MENCPTFYFSEECEQSIISYKNFSVNSSRNCALKDFIDPDRYLLNMQPQFVDWEEEEGAVRIGGIKKRLKFYVYIVWLYIL